MTQFNPPDLETRVISAFKALGDFMEIEWGALDQKYQPVADWEEIVTENTVIEGVGLSRTDFGSDMTVGQLLVWAEELKKCRLIDRRDFTSPNFTVVYIEPVNDIACAALGSIRNTFGQLEQTVASAQQEYRIQLVEGMTLFGAKIAKDGSYEKWCPPCEQSDAFVEVAHPGGEYATASALVESYLYEIHSSLGLQFKRARYLEPLDDWDEKTKNALEAAGAAQGGRLRPLLFGPGIHDLMVLFNEASSIDQVEYAVLGYTKVIEYVAATVVKQRAHQAIRTRLLSPAALRPDATFIEDFCALIEDQRTFQKDSEAIRLTIETCCDAPQLASAAPSHLGSLNAVTDISKPEERRDGLRKLAECISSTRNEIVHAKTNFTPKGSECPKDQLTALRDCLTIAAQQVIRWFSDVPESFRVLKGS
jgi:hypothetical protein